MGNSLQEHHRTEEGYPIVLIDATDGKNSDFDHHWQQSKKRRTLFISCDVNFFTNVFSTYVY